MSAPPEHPLSVVEPWDLFEKCAADAIVLPDLPAEARVVDVACGPGTFTFLVAPRATRVGDTFAAGTAP